VSDDYPVYFETAQEGIMSVRMEPCKPDGSLISEEEDGPYDDVEEPKVLLGKRLDLLVCINHARGINKAFSSEVSVSFELSRCANPNSEDGAFRVRIPRRRPSPPPCAAGEKRSPQAARGAERALAADGRDQRHVESDLQLQAAGARLAPRGARGRGGVSGHAAGR